MSENVPKAVQPVYDEITAITDQVCEEHLDEEYASLARQMTAKLARKRPSPLLKGTLPVWACAVVYALGQINFLFDKSSKPYMSTTELCAAFGVKPRTASEKANMIMDMLQIMQLDPQWTLPSRLGDNPMVWMLRLSSGIIIDARYAPRELQEEAFEMGLIPYIPADRIVEKADAEPEPRKEKKRSSKSIEGSDNQTRALFDFEPE